MTVRTYIIDAFTNKAFKGNPAGVCLLNDPISDEAMQSIASELNLSETAFLLQDKTNNSQFSIRYFTPTVEIAFCGHATLASSKLALDVLKKKKVEFVTAHNLHLYASSDAVGNIKMIFPLYDTIEYTPDAGLYSALGINLPLNTRYARELDMLLIEVEDKQTLVNLNPDYPKLLASSNTIKEVVVTAKSDDNDGDYDFYSRCFCPWIGINEDPVTGAAHSVSAKYWSQRLNKMEMKAYQVSKRGGYMHLKVTGDHELEVVSQAYIVLEGNINI